MLFEKRCGIIALQFVVVKEVIRMRIAEGFVVCNVGGKTVAVASGELCEHFSGMITLNETGEFLFEKLRVDTTEEALASDLVQEYGVDKEQALKDVKAFLSSLYKAGLIVS